MSDESTERVASIMSLIERYRALMHMRDALSLTVQTEAHADLWRALSALDAERVAAIAEANVLREAWEYEDELGDITEEEYIRRHPESRVIDGVRMFRREGSK